MVFNTAYRVRDEAANSLPSSAGASPNPALAVRQDVEFESGGITCRGWLTYPEGAAQQAVPLVVMAHGFSGTRAHGLEPYAHRFNAAGFATLIFDYRTFGASDGEPRNDVDWRREIADWQAAQRYVRSLPAIDTARIALWGTSFAGGLVLSIAARDDHVAAIICQCPMLDGLAAALAMGRYAGPVGFVRTLAHGLLDGALALIGASPHCVPAVGRPGEVGAMTSRDALQGYMRISGGPPNEVTARSMLRVPFFRPIHDAPNVRCPALLQICEQDNVAPPASVEKAARHMARSEVVRYAIGHFDVYVGEAFERSVRDQTQFLRKHLGP